ncbi:MAG: AAA family ATPase [Elusimicrobiota bacterium]|nr:AAA family ATPase [Elusimicrobiota bacterium]
MDLKKLEEKIKKESYFISSFKEEMEKVIIGQSKLIERLLIGILCRGHILLEGVPGLAKTLSVRTLAGALKLDFRRIQFTPDLLPADLIGTLIYNPKTLEFQSKLGPIFSQIILADEINRAPAKVQSALLEAMQEKQVTIEKKTHKLPEPFLVLATQNPIEQEGTYSLPEAQVDRFMLKIKVGYPGREEEKKILERVAIEGLKETKKVVGPAEIKKAQEAVASVYVDERIKNYAVDLVLASRDPSEAGLDELGRLIEYGASPRATIFLITAARGLAFIKQRGFVIPEDIKEIGYDVLRHRIILSYEAEAEEINSDTVIEQIFSHVEVP